MKKTIDTFTSLLFITICLLSGVAFASSPLPPQADIDDSLILYFPFDGNLKDYSGRNQHGSALSGYQFENGKYNQALHIGEGGVKVGQPGLLAGVTAYTISLWVNVSEHENYFFYDQSSDIGSRMTNGGGLYSYYNDAPADENLSSSNSGDMSDILISGEWHHLAYVWDSVNSFYKIYIDGVLFDQDTDIVNAELYYEPDDFFFVGGWDISYSPFNGSIDEFKLYSRALSAAEIQNLAEQSQVSYNGAYGVGYNAGIEAVIDNPKAFGVPGDAIYFSVDSQLELPSVIYEGNKYKVIMEANEAFQFNVMDAEGK